MPRMLEPTAAALIPSDASLTTLRDIGNEGAGFTDVDLKRAVDEGIIQGPRLFVATKALAPTGALRWKPPLDMPMSRSAGMATRAS